MGDKPQPHPGSVANSFHYNSTTHLTYKIRQIVSPALRISLAGFLTYHERLKAIEAAELGRWDISSLNARTREGWEGGKVLW